MHKVRLEEINRLFQDYRRQLEGGDGLQVADFYRFPLHYYREDSGKEAMSREKFVQQVARLLKVYRRLGVSQIVGSVTDIIEVNTNSSLVTLNWILLTAQGEKSVELYNTTVRYLVSDTDAGLKIDSLIMVDEATKIRRAVRAQGRQRK
ncbi:hypothetical protein [Microbulbifer thermotolerans]|uniref:SnoaL-like domain-containing protein n=1 Tax=Microbulbifer thermotolerans TaxID=252514 RepID=A0A143HI86_MICTH|nr:hypothetical protein [Microbulbifer thermotolerans]AMX01201.1 hypothetical protein A3224_00150 [Microbulbifer thermotolerans]MCX2778483.1 hypothetical protein [Microbulbifer thermotolerans]MCX2783954.1 hypothetical protein [Microbulbifer thermotolerans]MCX2793967.1 hypothetical protein [Microbulbifer thermotolerans]MCX2801671.1 hypothetical protein [Microbulbifer thermotolerans]